MVSSVTEEARDACKTIAGFALEVCRVVPMEEAH